MLRFLVPPGIGDFSAMYAKLCNIERDMEIIISCEAPIRLAPFLDILPNVRNGGYSQFGASDPVERTLPPGTDLMSLPDGQYYLSANRFLEGGGLINEWIPGKTDYHYKIDNKPEAEYARHYLSETIDSEAVVIGVYCSAYGNSRHWGFWDYTAWRAFLEKVHTLMPENVHYLYIGAEYDVAIADILHGWMASVGIKSSLCLGEFHIGSTIELISNMDYFFSFPSGLAFLADVVNTPHTMWLPVEMEKMKGTFCCPINYTTGRSFHETFNNTEGAFETFKTKNLKFVEERYARRRVHSAHHNNQ